MRRIKRVNCERAWSRRTLLVSIAATASACGEGRPRRGLERAVDLPDSAFTAQFAYPNGRRVQLDYLDHRNFRLAYEGGVSETLVVDGEIYLHTLKSAVVQEKLSRIGDLRAPPKQEAPSAPPRLQPTLIPAQGVARWALGTEVFDVATLPESGTPVALDATVAREPALARAQWVIGVSLLPAMNMSLCGDAVQQVTQSWPIQLTRAGWAVLSTGAGIRLDDPLEGLTARPTLPSGVEVLDYGLR